jgi:hypothetical protein
VKKKLNLFLGLLIFALFSLLNPLVAWAGPPDAAHSSIVASEVPANGSTSSTITVTLKDSSDVPLTDDTVSIAIPSDTTAVITPSSLTLNPIGIATFSATSTTPGTYSINVTDTTQATTLTALGTVIFDTVATTTTSSSSSSNNSGTPSNSCSETAPNNAPNFYQVNWNKTSATLYFTQPADVFDGYIISYGLNSNANNYSVSFTQGSTTGAIKYTVNNLSSDLGYYFKVRAVKGCAAGPWSVVRSVNANAVPVAGPGNLTMILGAGGLSLIIVGMCLFLLL